MYSATRDALGLKSPLSDHGPSLQHHGSTSSSSSSRKSTSSFNHTIPTLSAAPTKHIPLSTTNLTSPTTPIPFMRWSKLNPRGSAPPRALRAHTMTLVEDKLFVFGGCDAGICFNDLYCFDVETLCWSQPKMYGDIPNPCRAHSAVYLDGRIYVFGGGDGPNYFNTLYSLDTETLQWTEITPATGMSPGPRRAHTAWVYNGAIYIYAGGDGIKALNDVYALIINVHNDTVIWQKVETKGIAPTPRGYHTSNLVGNKLVVYGGSDGHECFADVHILDMQSFEWQTIDLQNSIPRLSHTCTLVGSYLFIFGGHDGTTYSNEVLLLNLVTMLWESKKIFGIPPSGRGYHTAVLSDSRVYVFGGYDGQDVFNDMWILDLSGCAYLPQITTFEIGADLQ
ncbi:hypothetical protein HK098_002142 [Nowakowskiella sp. JEL0407]|nr:hypothetical protein HK098_002142 [Nowakowskiella sp. JEL0407]